MVRERDSLHDLIARGGQSTQENVRLGNRGQDVHLQAIVNRLTRGAAQVTVRPYDLQLSRQHQVCSAPSQASRLAIRTGR